MLYKAMVSFCGVISMSEGEVREISDLSVVRDLLKAGYIEEYNGEPKKKPKKKRSAKK